MVLAEFFAGLLLGALLIAGPQIFLHIRKLKSQIAFLQGGNGHQVETPEYGSGSIGTKEKET